MDWRTLALLSVPGALIGGLSIFNLWGAPVEATLWTVLLVAWVVALVKRRIERPFLSGLVVGGLAGLWTAILQGAFASAYVANHPDDAALAGQTPLQASLTLVVFALVAGLVWGLLCGAATWALVKRAQRRVAADALSS